MLEDKDKTLVNAMAHRNKGWEKSVNVLSALVSTQACPEAQANVLDGPHSFVSAFLPPCTLELPSLIFCVSILLLDKFSWGNTDSLAPDKMMHKR